jgi:hypothetical protein
MKKPPARSSHDSRGTKRDKGRRKALKALAAGGGAAVLSKWSKPVIESVVLPAHAQATGPFTGNFAGALVARVLSRNWLDTLVPQAVAGNPTCGADGGAPICIQVVNDAVSVQVLTGDGLRSGGGTLIGDTFNVSMGGLNAVSGTLNGARTQFTGEVTLECVPSLGADASGAFTGERIQVASLMLAGVAITTSVYDYTANLNALCPIDLGS